MKCPKCTNTEPNTNGINCLDCNSIMTKDEPKIEDKLKVEEKKYKKYTLKKEVK